MILQINETFHEGYSGNEEIIFFPNEHFLNRQDGMEEERLTDTCFIVQGNITKKYHWECQSTGDNRMMVRIFEYDTQIALDDGEVAGDMFTIEFQNSAIIDMSNKVLEHLTRWKIFWIIRW